MFGLSKKKSPQEILRKKYQKLIKQSYELSTINRTKSDLLQAEAQEILNEIDRLNSN